MPDLGVTVYLVESAPSTRLARIIFWGGTVRRNEVDEDLKELAFDFLYFFARFEYALKANHYLKKLGVGQPAEAGWQRLREKFEGEYQLTEAAKALIDAAPKKQVVGENGTLDFKDVAIPENTSELGQVITHCNTVRNNLFHGGKSGPDGFDGANRTKHLLSLVLAVLDELAVTCDLNSDYTGYY